MKRSKRLYVLLGILVVVCAATFAATRMEEKKEQIKATGEIILEVSSEDVQSLSWEYGDTSLSFHKDGEWLYDDDEAFPVDEDAIRKLLEQFEAFSVSFVIEEVTDYGMYGLDAPICTIQFATADQTYQIDLGDFSSMDEQRYVSIGDGNVYLAKSDPLDQFDAVLKDIIKHDEPLACEQVSQITFEGKENYTIFCDEESAASYCADDIYFTEKNGETLPLDTDRVSTYLKSLTGLSLTDYVTYNVTEAELEACNLVTPELTITVDYTAEDEDGNEISGTYVLSVSRDPEELAAAKEAEANGEEPEDVTGYVRVGDSQIVYKISEYDCDNLMAASYDELRHGEILTADFEDICQIDITLDGADYTITAGDDGEERIWKYQGNEIDIEDLRDALTSMQVESADKFTVEGSVGKEEIRLIVYLDNENHPKVEIEFYRYDGSDCLAKVNGKTFALFSRADVVDLIEAVNAIVLN